MTAKREYFHLTIKHTYYDWFDSQCPPEKKHPEVQAKRIGAAAYWLNYENRAIVFYGTDSVEKIKDAKRTQAKDFINVSDSEDRRESTLIATVQDGFVWIYRCTGIAENGSQLTICGGKGEDKPDLPKSFPIQLFDGFPKKISDVPPVLAGTKANTYIAQSTFRKLPNGSMLGNIAAIQATTGCWEDDFKVDPLDCLASVELETLIAKLFEANGCFVPAARGDVLPGVDLFVTPADKVELGRLNLLAPTGNNRSTYSIQIKKKTRVNDALNDWLQRDDKHVLITLNDIDDQSIRHFGREWLREAINQTPAMSEWLMESLKWLPLERQAPPLRKTSHANSHPAAQAAEKPEVEFVAHLHPPEGLAPKSTIVARSFRKVQYRELNAKQKENFNFQIVSALLAEYGYMTLRLSSDWEGADFIAQHVNGVTFLKVQLKGRFTIDKKYLGKGLAICFPHCDDWYMCPHDELMTESLKSTNIGETDSWKIEGNYHAKKMPASIVAFAEQFVLREIEPDAHL